MTKALAILGSSIIGAGRSSFSGRSELLDLGAVLLEETRYRARHSEPEILPADYFQRERIGRVRKDLIGDLEVLDPDELDDDDDAGYIGVDDIIGALHAAKMGKKLTFKQRRALNEAHRAAKKAARRGNDAGDASELAYALRAAGKPIVRDDQENILRKLNMPLSTIDVAANSTNTFNIVVQESMRLERLFLYPVGGDYDDLWVGDIFCGRQTNSVVPGNEEPMINYSAVAVDSGIEGFTVNYGLTLRILIRNGTGAPVTVGGKIKGRTLTT